MTNHEILMKLDLTTNEAKVYLELINLGSSLASDVAKKSGLHRRPVYDALDRLIKNGLISYWILSGKKYFQTHSPERLLSVLKDKEAEVKQILPELIANFDKKQKCSQKHTKEKKG